MEQFRGRLARRKGGERMNSLYPVGRYWGRVTDQSLGQAKNTPTTQFSLRFEIVGRIVPSEGGEDAMVGCGEGERTVYMAITEKTIGFVTEDLVSIGYQKTSLRFLDPNVEGFHDFRGQELELYCAHDSYEGVEREKWRINRKGKIEVKPPDPKALRGLDVLFGKALKGLAADAKTSPPAAPSDAPKGSGSQKAPKVQGGHEALQEAAAEADDQIPF